jgi:hypothetical protein
VKINVKSQQCFLFAKRRKSTSHTINYNPEIHIIEVVVQGAVTLDEFKEIFSQGIQIAREKECFLFLNDFREATEINLSTMQIYNLPETLSGIAAPSGIMASRFKRAIVITPKIAADSSFAEAVAFNRGQSARFFQDPDEAKKWLFEK